MLWFLEHLLCARPRARQKVNLAILGRGLCLSGKWVVGDHDTDLSGVSLGVRESRCMEGSGLCLLQGGHWVLRGHHPFTFQQTFIEHLLGAGHCARFWVTATNKTGKIPAS